MEIRPLAQSVTLFDLAVGCTCLGSLAILHWVRKSQRLFPTSIPKQSVAISPVHPLGDLLGPIPGLAWGKGWAWRRSYNGLFGKARSDIIFVRSILGFASNQLFIADPTIIKTLAANRAVFPKPPGLVKFLQLLGPNVLSTEGEEWRHHRRLAGPGFTEKNLNFVWETSVEVIISLFEEWSRSGNGQNVHVTDFTTITTQLAFMVFVKAGFGMPISWQKDQSETLDGYTMRFDEALELATIGGALVGNLPSWLLHLFPKGRKVMTAYQEVTSRIIEMMEERRLSLALEDRNDILTNFIRAAESPQEGEETRSKFTQQEIMGNMFVFLAGGHETTASALAFAVVHLALYPEEQEKLYEHIRSVVPEGRLPSYQDVPDLFQVRAFVYETLRLHPIGSYLIYQSTEDQLLKTSDGQTLPVPAGTVLVSDIVAVLHHPQYWPDPQEFRPSRFFGDYDKDSFIPFSSGPRTCIGRRFSEIEQIAILSILVLHYKVQVLDEPRFADETFEMRKARVLSSHGQITLKPDRIPITFTRRSPEETFTL